MEQHKNKILIPVDFTEIADVAIENGIAIAKGIDAEIYLLHVIQKNIVFIGRTNKYDNELIAAGTINKLHEIADNIESVHKLKVDIIAIPGNIYDTINAVASEIGANFVVMGTHGMKGLQFIKGSNVLRIVYHSPVPYILTQKKNFAPENYSNVVFPVDAHQESAQKTDWAIYLAKKFNSKINVLAITESDGFLAKRINHNLYYIKNKFNQNNVNYTIETSTKDGSEFAEETNRYADAIKANMIMITLYPQKGAGEFFLTPAQQKIIMNPGEIPVLCINPGALVMLQSLG